MSGIINTTGAKSGVVGTTVGGTNAANVGSGALPAGVTGGTGLTGHARIGDTASVYLTNSMSSQTGGTHVSGGMTTAYNRNSAVFENHANGIKVLVAGTYLCTWSIYSYGTAVSGLQQEFLSKAGSATIDGSYVIYCRASTNSHSDRYWKQANGTTIECSANDVIGMYVNITSGSYLISGGGLSGTFLKMTYLSEHS